MSQREKDIIFYLLVAGLLFFALYYAVGKLAG